MTRLIGILTTLVFLLVPTAASAYQSFPANASQRLAIEQSAKATQICGYTGNVSQLSDFRVVPLRDGKLVVNFASVHWTPPIEAPDYCQLIFASEPGYTLKSVTTTPEPFVSWVPLSWGSTPLVGSSGLTQIWHHWFSALPPNWLELSRAFST